MKPYSLDLREKVIGELQNNNTQKIVSNMF
ncbi:MAG: hypothetical protein ACI9CD_001291, partial [Candidatus Deianiraeaceae bacterium]